MTHLGSMIFDSSNPLIVSIEPDGNGDWQIQPSDKAKLNGGAHNGQKHRDICTGRGGDMETCSEAPLGSTPRCRGALEPDLLRRGSRSDCIDPWRAGAIRMWLSIYDLA